MNNSIYAVCGTAFFIAFAVATAMYGSDYALPWVTTALLFAGLSQFFSQGGTTLSYTLASIFVFMALVSSALALGITFGAVYFPVT